MVDNDRPSSFAAHLQRDESLKYSPQGAPSYTRHPRRNPHWLQRGLRSTIWQEQAQAFTAREQRRPADISGRFLEDWEFPFNQIEVEQHQRLVHAIRTFWMVKHNEGNVCVEWGLVQLLSNETIKRHFSTHFKEDATMYHEYFIRLVLNYNIISNLILFVKCLYKWDRFIQSQDDDVDKEFVKHARSQVCYSH